MSKKPESQTALLKIKKLVDSLLSIKEPEKKKKKKKDKKK